MIRQQNVHFPGDGMRCFLCACLHIRTVEVLNIDMAVDPSTHKPTLKVKNLIFPEIYRNMTLRSYIHSAYPPPLSIETALNI